MGLGGIHSCRIRDCWRLAREGSPRPCKELRGLQVVKALGGLAIFSLVERNS